VAYPEKAGFRSTETINTGDVDRRRPGDDMPKMGRKKPQKNHPFPNILGPGSG